MKRMNVVGIGSTSSNGYFFSDGVSIIEIIFILWRTYFKDNNGICHYFGCDHDTTIVRMVMRKKNRKRKIMISTTTITMVIVTIACARTNILFLFSLFNKTNRNDIVLNSYSMILILYAILDDIYPLNDQFMIENVLQDNMTYNEKNIFSKLTIRCRDVLIVFILIITTNILEIMECDNRKSRMKHRKRKWKIQSNNNSQKNFTSSYNNTCKDYYFILFLLINKIDANNFIFNIYSMLLMVYTILDSIYELNNHFNSNIFQYISIYNKRNIFSIVLILYKILHGVYQLNCQNMIAVFILIVYDMNTNNKDKSKSNSNNIRIYECHIFIINSQTRMTATEMDLSFSIYLILSVIVRKC